jgi:hypothetical protein
MSLIFQFFGLIEIYGVGLDGGIFDGIEFLLVYYYYLPFGSIPLTLLKRDQNKRLVRAYKVCA